MSSDAVMGEALRQFRKSIGTKFLLFVLAFGSLALLVRLDQIKLELKKTREKPYQKQAVVAAFAKGTPLQKASMKTSSSGYDSPDALFDALYAKTGLSQERDRQVQATFSRYARAIGDRNTAIENLAVEASPAQKSEQLEHEIVRRDSLIEIRTMEIDRIERESSQRKADLRKEFDEAAISKHSFDFFQNDALNRIGQRFADGDDPVSVVFDILWYAALLVGIISIVGLILTPVFRAMPVAGTEERFWEQIKSLLGKAPRVGRGIAGLAAVTVGAVALMTTAATARSSPWKDAKFTPRRAYLRVVAEKEPLPHGPEQPLPPDPRIDKLVADVETLQATYTGQDRQLADHTKALGDHGRTLASHASALEPLIPLPGRVADVERWVGGFDAAENGRISGALGSAQARGVAYTDEKIRTVSAAFDLQIGATYEKIKTVEKDLNTAAQKIDTRADTITNGVFQPYLIGDRPSALKTVFGFDRYRATNATELILKENNADAAIVQAVAWLKQTDKAYTQGDFLRTLRVWTCGDQHVSCDAYVKWHALVLRTARM